jgi:glyoxylase-like metal-dependent hydrolase (beta-lactamase superfamily II)
MPATSNPTATVTIETFRAPDEGCLGYLVVDEDSGAALAIDPRLDHVDRFTDVVAARSLRLTHVLDTHTHADHLSGVRSLAQRTGAAVLAHVRSKLPGAVRRLRGGDTLPLGSRLARVLDAPGHTPDSLAVLVDGHLFTGDALFAGGAGRTDFPGGSAADLFDTFRAFEALPDDTVVHPGHDYVGRPVTTIGEEKASNPLFAQRDRAALVARLAGGSPPPANMAAILRYNVGEADAATIAPRELHALRGREFAPLVLDVRSAIEFEGERIEGAVLVPLPELDARVDEIPAQADVVVVCRTGVRATIAAETLARAGRRARVLEGGMNAWRRAKLPVREGRKRLPVDRQVQLIAGTMGLAGTALGVLVSPWFLLVPAFFGAGLTFAGATGTCGLALVLMKLPWNRPLAMAASGPGPGSACAAGATVSSPCAAAASASTCAAPPEPRS